MKIGCKKGSMCNMDNKSYCCLECSKFNDCEEPCPSLLDGETRKEYVLELCESAKRVDIADKVNFDNMVKEILTSTENDLLLHKGQELKWIIDKMVQEERERVKSGLR